ncbi:MAG: hypothetical protein RB191_20525 [Terriglobia bacterium]|nr:hypothetical protein [Terriglobia bacterium]
MTYSEKSTQLTLDSSVAVLALSNPDCTELELLPLKPRQMSEREQAQLAARWHGRNLRSIGVLGLVGTTPKYALKDSLEPEQVSVLADAFLAYLHALYCDSFAAQHETAEIQELGRLWSLPDTRIN